MRYYVRLISGGVLINGFVDWMFWLLEMKSHHDYALGLGVLFIALGFLVLREASGLFVGNRRGKP